VTIFAIDPGPTESAFVVWDGSRILGKAKMPNLEVLEAMKAWPCDAFVTECIASYGMAVGAEVFETCIWTGRYIQARNGNMSRLYRKDVKMHLCHSMRAKDSNIRQALIDRLGAPGTKKTPGATYGVSKDIWAALAVAVTFYDRQQKQF